MQSYTAFCTNFRLPWPQRAKDLPLMQQGTDGHPTRDAGVIASDKGVIAVSLDRAGGVLLHRLLQAVQKWEAYATYDGDAFEIGTCF